MYVNVLVVESSDQQHEGGEDDNGGQDPLLGPAGRAVPVLVTASGLAVAVVDLCLLVLNVLALEGGVRLLQAAAGHHTRVTVVAGCIFLYFFASLCRNVVINYCPALFGH